MLLCLVALTAHHSLTDLGVSIGPTVLAMGSHDLGDWETQFRKYDAVR